MLFVAPHPDAAPGDALDLDPEEQRHGAKVLRLRAGDAVAAVDGAGRRYPLVVTTSDRRSLAVELTGPPELAPPPGDPGSTLPRIELAVAWPKDARGEAMLGRLVQHGVARVRPLLAEHTGAERRAQRRERLERLAREHLKQCGGAWLPVVDEPAPLAAVLAAWSEAGPAAAPIVLDPRAAVGFGDVLAADRAAGARAVALLVGPEGGWSKAEEEAHAAAGCRRARLGPQVLRIETAAELAVGMAATLLGR